jgi:hypothetical protein
LSFPGGRANIASKIVPGTSKSFLNTWKSVFSTYYRGEGRFRAQKNAEYTWKTTSWNLKIESSWGTDVGGLFSCVVQYCVPESTGSSCKAAAPLTGSIFFLDRSRGRDKACGDRSALNVYTYLTIKVYRCQSRAKHEEVALMSVIHACTRRNFWKILEQGKSARLGRPNA